MLADAGSGDIDAGARDPLELESALEETGLPMPTFEMGLTGMKLSYLRDDSLFVVPTGCH